VFVISPEGPWLLGWVPSRMSRLGSVVALWVPIQPVVIHRGIVVFAGITEVREGSRGSIIKCVGRSPVTLVIRARYRQWSPLCPSCLCAFGRSRRKTFQAVSVPGTYGRG